MGYSEGEISAATLTMLLEKPLAECGRHLKLLTPDDLEEFKTYVIKKTGGAESMLTVLRDETDVSENEKLRFLKEVTEKEILAGYDLIRRIDRIFEKMEEDEAKAEKKREREEKSRARKIGLLKG